MRANILARGRWLPRQVRVERSKAVWRPPEELAGEIDALWDSAQAAAAADGAADGGAEGGGGGKLLFDGPMARVDLMIATPARFDLHLSATSYRAFYALQLRPELKGRVADPNDLPNPLGVSVVLRSADGQLLFGRRGSGVAYHPGRVHPFAGSMEPGEGSPFETALRELEEEVGLTREHVRDLCLLGVVQDPEIAQPEAVISARTTRTADEIRAMLDPGEHDAVVELPSLEAKFEDFKRLEDVMQVEDLMTPVCEGALELWVRDYQDGGGR